MAENDDTGIQAPPDVNTPPKPQVALSFPYTQSHPTHLYTIASLFGLSPKPVEEARILELGSLSGGNIVPMAMQFPKATFIGLDASKNDIDMGTAQIMDLNLSNVTLKCESIDDFHNEEGKFDYIICHGQYSWSKPETRDKILKICQENLTKNGIAYISYNTLPGWHIAESLKEVLMWHTNNITDKDVKTQQIGAFLKFVLDTFQNDNHPYAYIVKNEIHSLLRHTSDFIINDYLTQNNEALYFHQFTDAMAKHALNYVSDAFLPLSYVDNLPEHVAEQLKKINNIVYLNQFIDFIRNQRFRCSLVCHQETPIDRALKTTDIENMTIQFQGQFENQDLDNLVKDTKAELVCTSPFLTLKSSDPNYKLALSILNDTRFFPISYQKLCEKIYEKGTLKKMDEVKNLLNNDINLMRCALAGMIQINAYPPEYTTEISNKPTACPLARYYAQKQGFTTNRRHQVVALDPLSRAVVLLLDGKHTKSDLLKAVTKEVADNKINFTDENKQPITDPKQLEAKLSDYCDKILVNMAQQGLLIG